jgi:uncharacterized protein YwqG
MSFLKALFSKSKRNPPDVQGIQEHLQYLNGLTKPALVLSPTTEQSMSRIGGLPSLPENIPWPEWDGAPLAFLCQLDLSEVPPGLETSGLPPSGMLYFFYDQEQRTWGFDPEDKGSWRVIYTAMAKGDGAVRAVPPGLGEDYVYNERPVAFTQVATYPDWADQRVAILKLTEEQIEQYVELCISAFEGSTAHQLLGYPFPMQDNDMDLQCQLVSHGLYCGDLSGYFDPRAKSLEAGRADWVLLLQLDSDDEAGMKWGDAGMLYFWIKRSDLQEACFENCWMILQCP